MGLTAYLFPGQGSQYVGMGRELYERHPEARVVFDRGDQALGMSLSKLCRDGPEERLNDTRNTQPAILMSSYAAFRVLKARHLLSDAAYIAGHSMGEFSALVAAGALTFEDGLKLTRVRGELMAQAGEQTPGGMAAILGLDRPLVETICATVQKQSGKYVGVANDNCPGQLVISGAISALEQAMNQAREEGAKRVIRLAVSIAAHSPLMAQAAAEFKHHLDETSFQEPAVPIVANAAAAPLTDPTDIRIALGKQLTAPVRWTESMAWMIGEGVSRFVEIGPGKVLTGLTRRINRQVERMSVEDVLA